MVAKPNKEAIAILKVNVRASIYHREEGYDGAWISLPASKSELIDALDRARVPYGSGEYIVLPSYELPAHIMEPLITANAPPSLIEVNHLAQRLDRLGPAGMDKLEGVLTLRPANDYADVLNTIHNLDKFSFYPGLTTDRQLGWHAVENEIFPEFADMSDEAIACLDLAKVGARMRREEGGLLTRVGYLVPEHSGWDIACDHTLSERAVTFDEHDAVVRLLLSRPEEERDGVWLHCPCSKEDVGNALEAIHVESLGDCIVQRVESVVPALEYAIPFDCDIAEVNRLATTIKEHCMDCLPKYKAAYELEDITDLASARTLAERIEEYTLLPSLEPVRVDPRVEEIGLDTRLFHELGEYLQARDLEERGYRETAYGYLASSADYTQEREPEQTMEPTMGGI